MFLPAERMIVMEATTAKSFMIADVAISTAFLCNEIKKKPYQQSLENCWNIF